MNRMELCEEIKKNFDGLRMQIRSYTQQNMYDINIYCENFFLNLLNLLYCWQLENLNVDCRNEPGADLAEYDKKILIQVSSTCTKEKIQSSIDKSNREKYNGFRFIFISILEDAQKLRKLQYKCPSEISFDPQKDIFDLDILMKQIGVRDIRQLEEIHELVKRELDPYYKKKYSLTWFKKKVIENVKNMGERYSEELDIELEMDDIIDAMEQNNNFRNRFREEFEKVKGSWENFKQDVILGKQTSSEIEGILEKMQIYVNRLVNESNYVEINESVSKCKELNAELKKYTEKYNFKERLVYYSLLSVLRSYDNYLTSESVEIFQKKNVLIIGSAGIGKSHFMAHHALRRAREDKVSLLLLGQLFREKAHPHLQIKKQLGVSENAEISEIFEAMNQWGKRNNENAIVFLDALNEGKGLDLWDDYLNGIIEDLKGYPYVSLMLSIRDTYCEEQMLKSIVEDNGFAKIEFKGFTDVNKAVARFFAHYKVPYTINTSIMSQYRNPLFLKVYCTGYSEEKKDVYGLEAILEQYFYKIDKNIRKKYNITMFPKKQNIITFALDVFIDCRIEKGNLVQYDEVFNRLIPQLGKYGISFNILDELITENLLECITYEEKQYLYITYEIFDNYLAARRIVEESKKNIKNCEELVREIFSENNKYHKLIRKDYGVQEALAVILPDLDMALESEACEVYYWPVNDEDRKYVGYALYEDAYYKSMLWRKPERIKKIAHSYLINECFIRITGDSSVFDNFFEMMLQTAIVKNHIYNADFINEFLMGFSLNGFNRYWTAYISDGFHENMIFQMLLEWAWNCETNGLAENPFEIRALADVLVWFLASLNHNVRDITIKALMRIYRGNHNIIKDHLIKFRFVKDMYILEGVTASVYGALLYSRDKSSFCEIGEILYNYYANIPVDHILIRSYVENIFAYLAFLKIESTQVKFDKISCHVSNYYTVDKTKIDRMRNNCYPNPKCISELEMWGIGGYGEFEETAIYEHDKLIRNLEKDVMDVEIEKSEREYFYSGEVIDYIPYEDRINIIYMVIKEVFDMGYNELAFMDRDLHFSDDELDSIAYKYVGVALNRILDKYLSYKKKIYEFHVEREVPFRGIWQIPFYRWIDPTMDYFSCFETKSISKAEYELTDIVKDTENTFCTEDADGEWISVNKIEYYNREHQIKTARGYLVSNQKIRWFQGLLKDARHEPNLYSFEDLYIRELYWSPAYRYIQKECMKNSGLPDGIERISEEYIWDIGDGSMKEFISFSVVSKYLIEKSNLEIMAGSLELYKGGSVVVKSLFEETYTDILYMQKQFLSDFLKHEGKCVLWPFYESGDKLICVIFDGENFHITDK